ncbi:MAG: hypothetical protein ACI93T_000369, partial [Porticoccaceae bacterium]
LNLFQNQSDVLHAGPPEYRLWGRDTILRIQSLRISIQLAARFCETRHRATSCTATLNGCHVLGLTKKSSRNAITQCYFLPEPGYAVSQSHTRTITSLPEMQFLIQAV